MHSLSNTLTLESVNNAGCRLSPALRCRISTAMAKYQNRIELLQGTLDMLILKTLQWGPQHGYGIIQAVRASTNDVLQVETGSLYPALHRLEKQGWLASEWKQTESNQRAKYYRVTAAGKRQLAAEHTRWREMSKAIASIMERADGEPA